MILAVPLNIDWQQILLHLLNFVILVGALYFLLFSPIKKFIAKRTDYYKKMDEEANYKLNEAVQKDAKLTAKLNELHQEIQNEKQIAKKELERYKDEKIKEANLEASKIIESANQEALTNKAKIMSDCDEAIKNLVDDATEKLVLNASCEDAFDQFLKAAKGSADDGK